MKKKPSGVECLIQVLEALTTDCGCEDLVEGSVTLNQGRHEITINTGTAPATVYLSVKSAGAAVCCGDVDMVGSSLLPDGFVLHADIKSTVAEINYIIES